MAGGLVIPGLEKAQARWYSIVSGQLSLGECAMAALDTLLVSTIVTFLQIQVAIFAPGHNFSQNMSSLPLE
jgi:hypothetical protein